VEEKMSAVYAKEPFQQNDVHRGEVSLRTVPAVLLHLLMLLQAAQAAKEADAILA
jgi:hypothetical protein